METHTKRFKIAERETPARSDLVWLLSLFVGALVLRLIHLATLRESPFSHYLMLDPLLYDEWGRRIASGEWLGDRIFFQDPLYPYLLGVVYRIFGHRFVPVLAIQAILGAAVPPLLYHAARPWFGRTAAAAGGAAAALYLPSVYYGGLILKTWMTVLLVSLLMCLLSRVSTGKRRARWAIVGIVLGLATLTRGNLLLIAPVLILWMLLLAPSGAPPARAGRPRQSAETVPGRLREAWPAAALLVVGVGIVLVPIAIRNRVVGGEWVLTTSNLGQNFYIGNNPLNLTGRYQVLPFVDPNPAREERGFAREARRRTGRELGVVDTSRFWFAEALRWMRAEPGAWVKLLWRKLRAYWGAYEIPDNLDYYLVRESAPVLRLPVPGFGLVAPLGLLGALLSWRLGAWPRLLTLFVVVYSLSVIGFFVFSRFRMAAMPPLFVLGGFAVAELARRLRAAVKDRGALPSLARAVAPLVALLLFVNLPVRARPESRAYRWADALGLPTRAENSANGHLNLGLVYADAAKSSEDEQELLRMAERELREARRQDARFAKVHIELGKVLARQGRNEEAIEAYRTAAVIEPANYRIHHALGLLQRRIGNRGRAEDAFRRALALAPHHGPSAMQLGELLLEEGRSGEAAEAFRHALAVTPGDPRATRGLRAAEGSTAGASER